MIRCGDPPEKGGTGRTRIDDQPCRYPLRRGKDGNLYCLTHDCNLSERNSKVAINAAAKPERRKKLSLWGRWGFDTIVDKYGIVKAMSFVAEHHRQNPTASELWLYSILEGAGVTFERQYVIKNCTTAYILDACNPQARGKWVIEVDDGWRHKDRAFGANGTENYAHMVMKLNYLEESLGFRTLWLDTRRTGPETNQKFIYDFLGV